MVTPICICPYFNSSVAFFFDWFYCLQCLLFIFSCECVWINSNHNRFSWHWSFVQLLKLFHCLVYQSLVKISYSIFFNVFVNIKFTAAYIYFCTSFTIFPFTFINNWLFVLISYVFPLNLGCSLSTHTPIFFLCGLSLSFSFLVSFLTPESSSVASSTSIPVFLLIFCISSFFLLFSSFLSTIWFVLVFPSWFCSLFSDIGNNYHSSSLSIFPNFLIIYIHLSFVVGY